MTDQSPPSLSLATVTKLKSRVQAAVNRTNLKQSLSPTRQACAVFLLFVTKTAVTTLARGVYPFAKSFASAMGGGSDGDASGTTGGGDDDDSTGVSVATFFFWISIGELLGGLVVPAVSTCLTKLGPLKIVLYSTLACCLTAVGTGVTVNSLVGFSIIFGLFQMFRTLYYTGHSAFIPVYLPREKAAKVTALGEFSWGASSFLGLPFFGLVLSELGEEWVFHIMGALLLVCFIGFAITFRKRAKTKVYSSRPDGPDLSDVKALTGKTKHATWLPASPHLHPKPRNLTTVTVSPTSTPLTSSRCLASGEASTGPSDTDAATATAARASSIPEQDEAKESSSDIESATQGSVTVVTDDASLPKSISDDNDDDTATAAAAIEETGGLATSPAKPQMSPVARVFRNPDSVLLLIALFVTIAASIIVFGVFSLWLEDLHDLTAAKLGTVSIAIGVSELLGELVVFLAAGRFDTRKALKVSLLGAFLSPLLLFPVATAPLVWNMVALFVFFFFSQLCVVFILAAGTALPLDVQTTFFSFVHSTIQVARFAAAVVVAPVWEVTETIHPAATLVAFLGLIGLLCGVLVVRRQAKQAKLKGATVVTAAPATDDLATSTDEGDALPDPTSAATTDGAGAGAGVAAKLDAPAADSKESPSSALQVV